VCKDVVSVKQLDFGGDQTRAVYFLSTHIFMA